MIVYSHYRSGEVFGICYRFEDGDSLPTHSHDKESLHNIVVLKGRCRFTSEGVTQDLGAGDIYDFDGSIRHTITALSPCEILSLFIHGEPESYKTLSDEDRRGTI